MRGSSQAKRGRGVISGKGIAKTWSRKKFLPRTHEILIFFNELLFLFMHIVAVLSHCHSLGLFAVYESFIFKFKSNKYMCGYISPSMILLAIKIVSKKLIPSFPMVWYLLLFHTIFFRKWDHLYVFFWNVPWFSWKPKRNGIWKKSLPSEFCNCPWSQHFGQLDEECLLSFIFQNK